MRTKNSPNPLIVLAAYWNERYFIESSLKQIEALNPVEVIICDGCFEPGVPNRSTDGTREVIERFVRRHGGWRVVSALRPGPLGAVWLLLRGHRHLPWWTIFRPVRIKFLLLSFLKVAYRRNQAITFNHMIGLSEKWEPGRWFMTSDADQYYPDEMIDKLGELLADPRADLLTAKELTFFGSFGRCTDKYDALGFSNMPHRIYSDTLIQPNRSIVRETRSGGRLLSPRDLLARHLYARFAPVKNIGVYFHYKLNPPERMRAGYRLGDRKEPSPERRRTRPFAGTHPRIIREHFGV